MEDKIKKKNNYYSKQQQIVWTSKVREWWHMVKPKNVLGEIGGCGIFSVAISWNEGRNVGAVKTRNTQWKNIYKITSNWIEEQWDFKKIVELEPLWGKELEPLWCKLLE